MVDPRGYKKKYAPDERYAEAEPDARVWHVYNDECEHFDSDMINETSSSLDILLIFVRALLFGHRKQESSEY